MLEVDQLDVFYGEAQALRQVALRVDKGAIVSIAGANGAGKTTLLKTIVGHVRPRSGEVRLNGEVISGRPAYRIAREHVALVPEGRGLFSDMTVEENLLLGAYSEKDRAVIAKQRSRVYELFPVLAERSGQVSGTLSGGEQQLLAIGRGLMSGPDILMLDEPSLGVMPAFVNRIFEVLVEIRKAGTTILLIEQNVDRSLRLADYAYILQTGEIVLEGRGEELLENDMVRQAFLGMG
ncbi:MAG: ABC transporter ATP-binding protein [Hyphomicrobiales bacterium]|nr:ABC transporter ATP-binding protein [Hyphomicrobiales bacterium]